MWALAQAGGQLGAEVHLPLERMRCSKNIDAEIDVSYNIL